MDFIHKRNIVHGNIKPENIMIELKTDDIKLCDFGVEKSSDPNNYPMP